MIVSSLQLLSVWSHIRDKGKDGLKLFMYYEVIKIVSNSSNRLLFYYMNLYDDTAIIGYKNWTKSPHNIFSRICRGFVMFDMSDFSLVKTMMMMMMMMMVMMSFPQA